MTNINPRNHRDVTADDLTGLDGVPTYTGQAGGSNIYERTGKAAPTEVFPRSTPGSTGSTGTAAGTADEATGRYPAPAPAPVEAFDPTSADAAPDPVPAGPATAVEPRARRGTIDLGLLILRLVLGGYLAFHATATFFRLGASDGVTGLENAFSGYAFGDALAVVVPTLELAAGVFIVLGLVTPAAAMVAIAVTGFYAAHSAAASGAGINALMWDANVWLPVVLLGLALAQQFTGPGFYAVDAGRGWARRPLASSWIFAVLGIAAAGLMWWFGTGINPFA
ncbi:DoxX family protein [Corynebacterium liangguodongii]|uniref:DoxX family protein n=1 Tax=Corynebacterium liangguodongii TaxID=2079535 RepID=A0A2S0WDM3_9CORY|nr:DoxX family protein [Corynebacterium liangguodongii]AWB83866.1 DoxX family protein [Corynebacterium liangguodongii]PWB99005.1 DoxX family protein [Corynebacterium liangguodongii]